MSKTNRAFVLHEFKKFTFEERPLPPPPDDYSVQVHVQQTGICGSDVHYWQQGRIADFIVKGPLVLGHESSGIVTQVGKSVTNVKVGDLVAVEPGVPCRRCDYCRRGAYNLCADTVFAATPPHDGTLQTYYNSASDYVYLIPENMSMEDGALVEPVAVAVEIVKTAELRGGQTVIVFGCGPIGLLTQAVAKAYGASKVIGIDISKRRVEFAETFSADGVYLAGRGTTQGFDSIDASRAMAEEIISKFNLEDGADVVLECSGAEPCIQAGIFATKKGGTFVQAGMGRDSVAFPIIAACTRGLTIKGSIRYSAGCYPKAIELISSGKVQPRKIVSHRFKFEQAEDAFDLVKRAEENTLKVIIEGAQL